MCWHPACEPIFSQVIGLERQANQWIWTDLHWAKIRPSIPMEVIAISYINTQAQVINFVVPWCLEVTSETERHLCWALKIHPVRYSPDPEQLAAHIDKRNKGLGTEIILYCLHVWKTGPEKLNCLAQHCIRIIWQEWEANGEHQSALHGSACPFSNTNSYFFCPGGCSGIRQIWTLVSLHSITTLFKHNRSFWFLRSLMSLCPVHLTRAKHTSAPY